MKILIIVLLLCSCKSQQKQTKNWYAKNQQTHYYITPTTWK